ncbi:hypothetical protein [Actinophytocola gossypii]|uniref:Uncharacterized protein n=1 Tax=Actinophytocola gossypii TaxID=2812003 RepID=A0ABT2JAM2_9PSEU|nr:hypothetical protein [Actinophytocola gossypii]MCT2584808.1 hypothetical protein [Actinophytocola gossypii]
MTVLVAITTPTAWPRTGCGEADPVVVGQFEEVFTRFAARKDQDAFVSTLLAAGPGAPSTGWPPPAWSWSPRAASNSHPRR